ncbi:uncharacterized protein LOC113464587 [Ceratina calcarata]|uniref:Uncharacterized protein LOC113464587 n=1 Tax=Ceratina calcarata TaxID=156304 RepID=A0AAJ7S3S1_9HYME|nr:uncharacterized protein LOC113464587 [Ceratina calcarata]
MQRALCCEHHTTQQNVAVKLCVAQKNDTSATSVPSGFHFGSGESFRIVRVGARLVYRERSNSDALEAIKSEAPVTGSSRSAPKRLVKWRHINEHDSVRASNTSPVMPPFVIFHCMYVVCFCGRG